MFSRCFSKPTTPSSCISFVYVNDLRSLSLFNFPVFLSTFIQSVSSSGGQMRVSTWPWARSRSADCSDRPCRMGPWKRRGNDTYLWTCRLRSSPTLLVFPSRLDNSDSCKPTRERPRQDPFPLFGDKTRSQDHIEQLHRLVDYACSHAVNFYCEGINQGHLQRQQSRLDRAFGDTVNFGLKTCNQDH